MLAAPDSIVRAIFAAGQSPARERVLAALGLGPTGQPVSTELRDAAVAALRASADSSVATQAELPVDEVAGEIDQEIPW